MVHSVNAGHSAQQNWTCLDSQWSLKAFNYLSAPIESVRDCFQKPLKGSIHNRGACTLSVAGRKTTIYLFTFEKANRYKFVSEINLPLSFFLCLLPHPFPNLSPHLVFIYLFSRKATETAEDRTLMRKKEASLFWWKCLLCSGKTEAPHTCSLQFSHGKWCAWWSCHYRWGRAPHTLIDAFPLESQNKPLK